MFGLDDKIAGFSDGTTLIVLIAVAVLLGLRHATDPDHLAAVSTLISSGRERGARAAARLGLLWGLGHATTLFVFGLPIVLYRAFLPGAVQEGAEIAVGIVIVALAAWLLLRWHRGMFHPVHHEHRAKGAGIRTPIQAYGIGLVHGTGGSAGVGILLLSAIDDRLMAVAALGIFALFTALSMAILSTGLGATLGAGRVYRSFHRIVPALGVSSMAFGVWYALGALSVAPYYL
jgi:High-affinity nickel-transport protein